LAAWKKYTELVTPEYPWFIHGFFGLSAIALLGVFSGALEGHSFEHLLLWLDGIMSTIGGNQ
jgi:hypothetical protein